MGVLGKTWNDVKGNVKYDIIKYAIFVLGASLVAALYRWVQHIFHLAANGGWVYALLSLLVFIACVLCAIASNLSRRDLPRFSLELGSLVWLYQKDRNITVFFILASVTNRGEPSVTLNWKATYKVAGCSEDMEMMHILHKYEIPVGKQRLTLTNENLVNLKTLEVPVQRGQYVGGRLLLTLPGDRTAQIRALQYQIDVEVQDYLGNVSKAGYHPASKVPESLVGHYKELREPIEDVEQPKPPVSVSDIPVRELPATSS